MLNTWCFSCLSCKILFELKIENFTQKSFVKHCLFLHLLTIFLHYTLPYTRTVSSQLVYLSLYTACRKVITTGYHNMLYTVTVWFHINSTERYTVVFFIIKSSILLVTHGLVSSMKEIWAYLCHLFVPERAFLWLYFESVCSF